MVQSLMFAEDIVNCFVHAFSEWTVPCKQLYNYSEQICRCSPFTKLFSSLFLDYFFSIPNISYWPMIVIPPSWFWTHICICRSVLAHPSVFSFPVIPYFVGTLYGINLLLTTSSCTTSQMNHNATYGLVNTLSVAGVWYWSSHFVEYSSCLDVRPQKN